jgi:hypothetical protein
MARSSSPSMSAKMSGWPQQAWACVTPATCRSAGPHPGSCRARQRRARRRKPSLHLLLSAAVESTEPRIVGVHSLGSVATTRLPRRHRHGNPDMTGLPPGAVQARLIQQGVCLPPPNVVRRTGYRDREHGVSDSVFRSGIPASRKPLARRLAASPTRIRSCWVGSFSRARRMRIVEPGGDGS